jgi:hypothetical protein
MEGGRVFEVYKKFAPLPGVHHSMWCPPRNGGMGAMGMMQPQARGEGDHDPSVIFVGLDVRPLEEAVAGELRTNILITVLVLLMGWADSSRFSGPSITDSPGVSCGTPRPSPRRW